MADDIYEKFQKFNDNKATVAFIVMVIAWIVLQTVVSFVPSLETEAGGKWEDVQGIIDWLQKLAVPGTLLLLLVYMLVPGKTDAAIAKLSVKVDRFQKDQPIGFEYFGNINDFFGDLIKQGVDDQAVTKLLVTRVRIEDDVNYDQHPNVKAYYDRVVERCQSDPNFELTRIVAAQTKRALLPVCEKWFDAITPGNARFTLKLLEKNVSHSFINLVIVTTHSGPKCVYVILCPTNATVTAIRLSDNSEVLKTFSDYYQMMESAPGNSDLTHDNFRTRLAR